MTGLLIKDYYTIVRQLRLFLLMILFFSCLGGAVSGFAVLYSCMLPVTALAYDERAKWPQLAAMMPYSARDLTLSKYVLGYLSVAATAGLSCLVRLVVSAARPGSDSPESFVTILFTVCIGLMIMAIMLPFLFRFGVEKGRVAFFVLVGAVVAGGLLFGNARPGMFEAAGDTAPLLAGTALAALAANVASVSVSARIYRHRRA